MSGMSRSDARVVFLYAMAGYVGLLCTATVATSGLLRALSYPAAFVLFVLVAVQASTQHRSQRLFLGFGFPLAVYYYGLIGSVVFNFVGIDWATTSKLLMVPLFVLLGERAESSAREPPWERWDVRVLFITMAALPLLVWVWQLVTGRFSYGSGGMVSIFANRNNAALYAISLIALMNLLRPHPLTQPLVYAAAGVLFGTLGVLLAVVVALGVVLVRKGEFHRLVLPAITAAAILVALPLEHGLTGRFAPARDSLYLIAQGEIDLRSVTYAQLVNRLQTTDLSLVFRLKHWLDLMQMLVASSPFEWVFGFGIGSSVILSEAGLVPHNDYLRVLFEAGLVAFLGFVSLVALILRRSGAGWEGVPILVVAIYFFSENLINNFPAMAVFFFAAGGLAARIRKNAHASSASV